MRSPGRRQEPSVFAGPTAPVPRAGALKASSPETRRRPRGSGSRRRDPGAPGAAARVRGLRAGRAERPPPWAARRGAGPAPPARAGGGATSTASLLLPPSSDAPCRDAPRPCPPGLRAGRLLSDPRYPGAHRRKRKPAAEAEPACRSRPSMPPQPAPPEPGTGAAHTSPPTRRGPRRRGPTQATAPRRLRGYLAAPRKPARDTRRQLSNCATATRHRP